LPEYVRCKRLDDSIDKLGKLFKRFDNHRTGEWLSISKAYLEKSQIVVEFDVLGEKPIQYRAVFHGLDGVSARAADHIPSLEIEYQRWLNHCSDDRDYEFVFVSNVEVVHGAKTLVPSLVRLQRADHVLDVGGGAVQLSLLDHCIQIRTVVAEREVDPIGAFSVRADEVAGKQIERGSEIMNRISDDESEVIREVFTHPDDPSIFALFSIRLFDDYVWLAVKEGCLSFLKIRNVSICPTNL